MSAWSSATRMRDGAWADAGVEAVVGGGDDRERSHAWIVGPARAFLRWPAGALVPREHACERKLTQM